jgi:hypothetical protein
MESWKLSARFYRKAWAAKHCVAVLESSKAALDRAMKGAL